MSWDGADVILRNKLHNKFNVLESSPNHAPYTWSVEKLSSMELVSGAKQVGECWLKQFLKKNFFSSKESRKIDSLGPAWNSHSYMGLLSHHSTILTTPSSWFKMAAAAPPSVTLYELLCEPLGFPGGSDGKESACNMGDLGSILGLKRPHWRRKWLPTPVFLPREFHGQRRLVGYRPWGLKELDTTGQLTLCEPPRKLLHISY